MLCLKYLIFFIKNQYFQIGSAKSYKRILSIKRDEIPASKTVLRFSLPGDDNTSIEQ